MKDISGTSSIIDCKLSGQDAVTSLELIRKGLWNESIDCEKCPNQQKDDDQHITFRASGTGIAPKGSLFCMDCCGIVADFEGSNKA